MNQTGLHHPYAVSNMLSLAEAHLNNFCRSVQTVQPEFDSQDGSSLAQSSTHLDWLQRHLTSSPFDRSFTAANVSDDRLYALPEGARAGRLEPSIDAEGISVLPSAADAAMQSSSDGTAIVSADAESECAADTSQWHHYADDQMKASMLSNSQPCSQQQTPLHSPRNQIAFAAPTSHAHTDGNQASSLWTKHLTPPQHTASTPERMHSSFAASWLHSTGSSILGSQTSTMQPVAMQAWAAHTAQQLPASSSTASLPELQDLDPRPPAMPSTSHGLVSAPSGFKGRRGATGDPRLKRFREASAEGTPCVEEPLICGMCLCYAGNEPLSVCYASC